MEPVNVPDLPSDTLINLLGTLGAGGLIGFAIGYFVKKSLKLVLFFIGFQLVIFFVAEYYGLISVLDGALVKTADGSVQLIASFTEFLKNRLAQFTAQTTGMLAGFYLGIKTG